jgi:hypothetical protein
MTWAGGEVAWRGIRSARAPKLVPYPTEEDHARVIRGIVTNTAVSFLQQGAILGAVLGLAGGLAQRSSRTALMGAVTGGVLGVIAAGLAAQAVLPVYYRNVDPQGNDLLLPLLTHGTIWAAIGAAAGLAFGLGTGRSGWWARCAFGGLLGSIAATVVYDLVGALAFPVDKTSEPVSATALTRLVAHVAVAVLTAGGAAVAATQSPTTSRANVPNSGANDSTHEA